MAKFKYGMQNILDLKSKLEEQQKMALATARINLNDEEDRLNGLYLRKQDYENKLRASYKDKLDVNAIKRGALAYESMDYFIGLQKIEVKKAEGKVKIEQDKMVEAMKERKIQEKLKEKAFGKFIKEMNAEEAKLVDELVAYKYGTSRNEEEWR
ncbi:MAG: flagellar export protein FliJ [Catonella sp.]|uniref:flagellar export protein FliJ n=1 Tax=Catonella sp. TaxID=2382125 RepID=UPI003FA044BB